MSLLFTLLVVVVIGGIVVVALGGGEAMSEEPVDRPDPQIPADGPLTADDLRRLRLGTALRGYRASDVDALLERLARQLDEAGPRPGSVGEPEEPPGGGRSPYEAPPPVR